MRHWIKGAIALGAMTLANPSFAATAVDLSATDYAKSTSTQTFAPGQYAVSLVSGVYDAWSARTPAENDWVDYYDYTIDGVTTRVNPLDFQRYATASDALAAYSAAGPLTFTFTAPTTVTFAIADYPSSFGDNFGGVSLSISAVPEPATWLMMIVGFGAIGLALRAAPRGRRAVAIA